MLYLVSDFGWQGPYVGQMKSVVANIAHSYQIIDLMHDVPRYNIESGAYLLAAITRQLPQDSVIAAIVDPGVGSDRKAIVLRADYRWYVGPDNGLFDVVANQASSTHWYEIINQPHDISASFHGRDVFAPMACQLLMEDSSEEFLKPISCQTRFFSDVDLNKIIYIDQFGNLMTGMQATNWKQLQLLNFAGHDLHRARTFSDVEQGQAFFYENSQGLLEIAINCGNAREYFSAEVGATVKYG